MSLLKEIFNVHDIKKPIFLKDFNMQNKQIKDLEVLLPKINNKSKNFLIHKDIITLKEGLAGENNVYYELKNSYVPMLCLHNIRIELDGNTAQFNFIIITHYFIMILETKKLSGDITINESGEFIRIFKNKYGKITKKEGIYSPISQNERHVRILKDYLAQHKFIKNFPIKSLVLIANSKSIINRNKAPYSIKNKIFKSDQLTNILNAEINKYKKEESIYESKMYKIANSLLDNHKDPIYDYYKKYSLSKEDFLIQSQNTIVNFTDNTNLKEKKPILISNPSTDFNTKLRSTLKKYRYTKSKEENIKAYFIFNDKVLDELVEKKPQTLGALIKIKGFGEVKTSKYGNDIINIMNLNL